MPDEGRPKDYIPFLENGLMPRQFAVFVCRMIGQPVFMESFLHVCKPSILP